MNRLLVTLILICALRCPAGTLAQFHTAFGTIDVELYDSEKPVTVQNFKRLVQAGAYRNTFFHRLVPGFVVQGGGFTTINAGDTNAFGPPWSNFGYVPNFGAISNEYSVGPLLSNTNGTLAMAKVGGDSNSATSQWFFSLTNNAGKLDNQNGGFTVFGRVIRDPSSVLAFLNQRSFGDGIQPMDFWYPTNTLATNLFTTLPVTYPGASPPRYADLLYVSVSLLSVQIGTTNGLPTISWTTVAGQTNWLEFSTNFPPVWQPLGNIVGNGSRIIVTDSTADIDRFYRVRVDY